jgi:carbamoyltransferase
MVTIGVNYLGGPGHDSAVALAEDGKILYAIAEERLSRIKHDAGFPKKAIDACLNYKGINIQEVDELIFGWPELKKHFAVNFKLTLKRQLKENLTVNALHYYRSLTTRNVKRFLEAYGLRPRKISHIDHHQAHALSVLPYLKNNKSLVFVIDGRGIKESTTIYLKNDMALNMIKRINFPNSLGLFYAEITSLCGFRKYTDEWKVMGLAPYGKKSFDLTHLIYSSNGVHHIDYKQLINANKLALNGKTIFKPDTEEEAFYNTDLKDLAFSAQYFYEQVLLDIVEYYSNLYGIKSIGLAGGVGLNCKANGYILRKLHLDEFFIQPASTDDGTALGAALYPFYMKNKIKKCNFNPFLGNSYRNQDIKNVLDKYHLRYLFIEEIELDAAYELANENIIGWFQGKDEFGPRALGNRSILSDPRNSKMKDRVNEIVKYRECWRPFAPSLLKEYASEVLSNIKSSPYMILTDYVNENYADKIPAVVHVDKTLRPQTVDKELNPRYWKLINEFYKITGVPVVMNTSFNLKGEPNVSSPTDAIRTFFTSGLDILYMGNYKVMKQL